MDFTKSLANPYTNKVIVHSKAKITLLKEKRNMISETLLQLIQNVQFSATTKTYKQSKKQESRSILWGQPALTPQKCTILWRKKQKQESMVHSRRNLQHCA